VSPHNQPVAFESLGLSPALLTSLTRLGYEEPTPIQREAIPPLLAGKDVLGQAATGTGKTAAFALPMLSQLKVGRCKQFETSALVLVPTRELALQVAEAVRKYGSAMGVSVLAIYGGEEIGRQLKPLRKGVDVVVATPGRAIDHLTRKSLLLGKVGLVVLDEADEMLDMGFADDLETILKALPDEHQTALFSATMPSRILKIAERHLSSPVRVSIARQLPTSGEAPKVRQTAYVVPRRFKTVALTRIFQLERPQSALIFCRTRDEVDELSSLLIQQGMPAAALHGGLTQDQRDRVMKKFKTSAVKFLVATDVAARGLHIENLSHVVNYDVPNSPEAYVHRIGRTGRAGREGSAITLAEPQETRLIQGLERAVGGKIALAKVPTPEELRARKLQLTKDAVLEAAQAGGGAFLRTWIDETGLDPSELAAAAIELLHTAQNGTEQVDDVQIPTWQAPKPGAHKVAAHRPERGFQKRHDGEKPARTFGQRHDGPEKTTVWIGAGERAGIRPGDLVGAIANEAQVDSKLIGPIQIREGFSLVGIPKELADRVISAMQRTTLRGRKVQVRRER
jgi:ATP-dependent RNA helicase DeaD